jgi:hypothetical protein
VVDQGQAVMGYAYVGIAYWALAATTVALARRTMPVVFAFAAAVVVLECFRVTSPDEQTQLAIAAMACGWALMVLRAEELPGSRRWLPLRAALGAFAAVAVLVKLNTGLTVALVLGVAALATTRDRRRALGAAMFAAGFLVTLLALWTALGQSLGALDDYVRTSYEVVAGFADSMQADSLTGRWEYAAAAAVLAGVAGLALEATRGWPAGRRLGGLAVTALVMFGAFKQGFVRHDGLAFFATGAFVALALGSPAARPRWGSAAVAALCVVSFLAASAPELYELHRPGGTRQAVRDAVATLRDPETLIAASLSETREREGIPASAIAAIGRRSVHIYPQEAAAAWSQPGLTWRPLPVFQDYQAYTPALTRRNADMLRSDRAPERILRHVEELRFADPETTIELACRYVHALGAGEWQVLARVPDRCETPEPVARVEAATEEAIRVPAVGPDELLLMRVEGMKKGPGESLAGFLWKPNRRAVSVDGKHASTVSPTLAGLPALITAGAAADYPRGFRLAPPVHELRFQILTHGVVAPIRSLDRPLTVEFLRVPVDPA